MNTKLWIVLFLFLLSGVFATFSITQSTISPTQVKPGEYGTISLVITNLDTSSSAKGISVDITSGSYISMEREVIFGDMSPGATVAVTLPFKVDKNAPTGIYPVYLDIYGQSAKVGGGTEVEHKKVIVAVKIVNPPAIQLTLSKNQINEIDDVLISANNDGGTAKNIYLSISSKDVGFLNKDVVYIEKLVKNATVPVTIDARNAVEGSQKLEMTLKYEDELGNVYEEKRSLPVNIKKESGEFVFTQLSSIVTGKQGVLKLEIRNKGTDVENLRISTTDQNFQLVGVSEFNVGNLKSGEAKVVDLPIIANVDPGSKLFKLNLKWVVNGENRESTKSLPIRVSSDADVGVYFEAKPTPLYPNSEYTISVTVSNLGSYPIEATTTKFSSDAFELLSIQPEQYIGGLNKDDFSSVQYKVRTKNLDSGTYPITVTVNYRDASGEWKTKNVTVNVNILPPVEKKGMVNEVTILGVVVIAAAIYFIFFRKKR